MIAFTRDVDLTVYEYSPVPPTRKTSFDTFLYYLWENQSVKLASTLLWHLSTNFVRDVNIAPPTSSAGFFKKQHIPHFIGELKMITPRMRASKISLYPFYQNDLVSSREF